MAPDLDKIKAARDKALAMGYTAKQVDDLIAKKYGISFGDVSGGGSTTPLPTAEDFYTTGGSRPEESELASATRGALGTATFHGNRVLDAAIRSMSPDVDFKEGLRQSAAADSASRATNPGAFRLGEGVGILGPALATSGASLPLLAGSELASASRGARMLAGGATGGAVAGAEAAGSTLGEGDLSEAGKRAQNAIPYGAAVGVATPPVTDAAMWFRNLFTPGARVRERIATIIPANAREKQQVVEKYAGKDAFALSDLTPELSLGARGVGLESPEAAARYLAEAETRRAALKAGLQKIGAQMDDTPIPASQVAGVFRRAGVELDPLQTHVGLDEIRQIRSQIRQEAKSLQNMGTRENPGTRNVTGLRRANDLRSDAQYLDNVIWNAKPGNKALDREYTLLNEQVLGADATIKQMRKGSARHVANANAGMGTASLGGSMSGASPNPLNFLNEKTARISGSRRNANEILNEPMTAAELRRLEDYKNKVIKAGGESTLGQRLVPAFTGGLTSIFGEE